MNKIIFKYGVCVLALALCLFSLNSGVVFAYAHGLGTNISAPDGTVYAVTSQNGQTVRRPYTSAGAFLSYGFNSWGSVVAASSDDMALPLGSFIPPQDGKIICSDRGSDKGTCYIISRAQKFGFPSASVFTQQGFSFSHALSGDVSFLPSGAALESANQGHNPGTIVNKDGTLYFVGNNSGLWGFPSASIFTGWGYSFADAVTANSADRSLSVTQVLPARQAGSISPFEAYSQSSSSLQINNISPASGPINAQVVITGTGFAASGNYVSFQNQSGHISSGLTSADGTSLTFTVPDTMIKNCSQGLCSQTAVTPGSYNISVTTNNVNSNTLTFTVTSTTAAAPTITNLNPSSGTVGTNVTITGSGFTPTGNTVNFGTGSLGMWQNLNSSNGMTLQFNATWNYTCPMPPPCIGSQPCAIINCQQPAPPSPGTYPVTVINANGTSNSVNFNVTSGATAAPVISQLTPSSGAVGSVVTITGNGFTPTGNKITFGSLGTQYNPAYSVNSTDGSTLSFTVPSSDYHACQASTPPCYIANNFTQLGSYPVSVTNANGTSNSVNFNVTNAITASPYINSLSPTSGPTGTIVTIIGTGFAAKNTVYFGTGNGYIYPNVVSNDGKTILFTIPTKDIPTCPDTSPLCTIRSPDPPITPGTYPITVINSSQTSNSVTFTVTP